MTISYKFTLCNILLILVTPTHTMLQTQFNNHYCPQTAARLYHHIRNGNCDAVEEFIRKNKHHSLETLWCNNTPLSQATVEAHEPMILLLLQKGAAPDTKNTSGITPLMIAAKWKLFTIATSLVTYGADPFISTGSQSQWICLKGEITMANDAQAIDFCDEENKPLFEKAINGGFIAKKKRIRPLLDQYLPVVLRNIVEEYSHEHYALKAQPTRS